MKLSRISTTLYFIVKLQILTVKVNGSMEPIKRAFSLYSYPSNFFFVACLIFSILFSSLSFNFFSFNCHFLFLIFLTFFSFPSLSMIPSLLLLYAFCSLFFLFPILFLTFPFFTSHSFLSPYNWLTLFKQHSYFSIMQHMPNLSLPDQ